MTRAEASARRALKYGLSQGHGFTAVNGFGAPTVNLEARLCHSCDIKRPPREFVEWSEKCRSCRRRQK